MSDNVFAHIVELAAFVYCVMGLGIALAVLSWGLARSWSHAIGAICVALDVNIVILEYLRLRKAIKGGMRHRAEERRAIRELREEQGDSVIAPYRSMMTLP